MKKMCDCFIINNRLKIIDDCIYVDNIKICGLPFQLKELLVNGKSKIKINNGHIFINEWEFKDGEFKKTFKGYINKFF